MKKGPESDSGPFFQKSYQTEPSPLVAFSLGVDLEAELAERAGGVVGGEVD